MAYPMIRFPTLEEFIRRACEEYGATLETKPEFLLGPRGKVSIRYLAREGHEAILPDTGGDRLTPTLLRSLCAQLRLPAAEFGLTLDDWSDAESATQDESALN